MTTGLCLLFCGFVLGGLVTAFVFRLRAHAGIGRDRKRGADDLEHVLGLAARGPTPNGDLSLDFLTTLTAGIAEKLAMRRHGNLYLNGLATISDEAAQALMQCAEKTGPEDPLPDDPDTVLDLEDEKQLPSPGQLAQISDEVTQALKEHAGDRSDEEFFAHAPYTHVDLARHRGILFLDGLTELSAKAAHALATHEGDLSLNGLATLSPEVAKGLARHRTVLWEDRENCETALSEWRPKGDLSLKGLKTISDSVARALAEHEGDLFLDGLTVLSEGAAQALSQHRSRLSLNGLTTVSPEAAAALAQHKGDVILDGLATLSPDVARAFARHQGNLYLDGVIRLPDESVKELVQCDCRHGLFLRSLATVSDEASSLLRSHHNIELPATAKDWEAAAWPWMQTHSCRTARVPVRSTSRHGRHSPKGTRSLGINPNSGLPNERLIQNRQ